MKAEIKSTKWLKQYTDKFGEKHLHEVIFIDENLEEIKCLYSSKSKDQKFFKAGSDAEFTTELIKGREGHSDWTKIKPVRDNYQSGGGRAIKKEQSRYSGFAVSYVKDLIVAGHLKIDQWKPASRDIFNFMVDLDKTL